MAWVRLEDTFPEHPKIDAAGGDAGWLHVCALAYCNRNLTDGFIATNRIPQLSDRRQPLKLAERLVECGLWEHDQRGGYLIHDYLDYQPTRNEVEDERAKTYEKKSAAGRLGGYASGVARRKHKRSTSEANGEADGKQNEAPTRPDPSPGLQLVHNFNPSLSPSDGLEGKKRDVVNCYVQTGWAQANQSKIGNRAAFERSLEADALGHPKIDEYVTCFPTASASEIAAWLRDEKYSMRYHTKVEAS